MDHLNLIQKKLTGSLTPDEDANFQNWLTQSDQNLQEYKRFQSVWNSIKIPQSKEFINLEEAKERFWKKESNRTKVRTLPPYWFKLAAAILLLFVSGLLLSRFWFSPEVIKLVATDSLIETQLPDGSNVWLYKDSELIYSDDFNSDHRNITLNGLAFFEVTKNEERPFIISCLDGDITVVGTSFEVKSYPGDDRSEVSVTTGIVSVDFVKGTQPVLLKKDDKIVYDRSTNQLTKGRIADNEVAWKTGDIVFDDTSIDDALKILTEYFNMSFMLENKSACMITTTFRTPSIEEVIDELKFLLDADIKVSDNQVIIKTADCN